MKRLLTLTATLFFMFAAATAQTSTTLNLRFKPVQIIQVHTQPVTKANKVEKQKKLHLIGTEGYTFKKMKMNAAEFGNMLAKAGRRNAAGMAPQTELLNMLYWIEVR